MRRGLTTSARRRRKEDANIFNPYQPTMDTATSPNCGRCGRPTGNPTTLVNGIPVCPWCAAEMYKPHLPTGWICPRCGKVLSPFVKECLCENPPGEITVDWAQIDSHTDC